MSSSTFIDPKALKEYLEQLLRNFNAMEESQIERLAKTLTYCILVISKHNMRKTKEPLIVENLKFRWKKEMNRNKMWVSKEPRRSLLLVEKLPNREQSDGSLLLNQREILLRGPLVHGEIEALRGFRDDMKRYLCELKEWQMTKESVKQLRTELLDESYAADGEWNSMSDESEDTTDVEDDVVVFEFTSLTGISL